MKTPSKKLLLTKESLRSLTDTNLDQAGGAGPGPASSIVVQLTRVTCKCPVTTSTVVVSITRTSMPSSVPISY